MEYLNYIIIIFSILVGIVNIFVQIIKQFTYKVLPTRVLTVLASIVLSICTVFVAAEFIHFKIFWYHIVGGFIGGIIVSYAAMYGFDEVYKNFWDTIKKFFVEKG